MRAQAKSPNPRDTRAGWDVEETLFRRLSGHLPGLVYVFNHDTMCNETLGGTVNDCIGYSEDALRSMGSSMLKTLMHPEDFERLGAHFDRLQRLAPEEEAQVDYRVRSRSGEEVWLRSIDVVIDRRSDGTVRRHAGVALDVTSEKVAQAALCALRDDHDTRRPSETAELRRLNTKLRARLDESDAALEAAQQDLKQLTYIATHDLRVPVNNMTSLVHMLSEARPLLPSEHLETLDWMHDVCTQASEKIDALICAAQATAESHTPFEDISIEAALEEVLVNLHYQTEQARATIRTALDAKSVFFLRNDLIAVLQALISNSVKYRDPDRRLRITVKAHDVPGGVRIDVADNGSGIDMERDSEKIFALFQRAHVVPGGAGVSLYLVRQIVARSGGHISVDSRPGEGTVFSVFLPSATTEDAA